MGQGITEGGQQEHNNVMVGAVGHEASVGRLPLYASRHSHVPGSPTSAPALAMRAGW